MTFKEVRELSGLNQLQFAKHFGIPYRTVQNWEHSVRRCPTYVISLLLFRIKFERGEV
jgi:DNA-binding transcriptional regulator YiaG